MGYEYNAATDSFSDGFNTYSAKDMSRVQEPATPAPQPAIRTTVEVGRGGTELTIRNGQMIVTKDSDKVNTFDAHTGFAAPGDLLSTARSKTGTPVTGRPLAGSDTVEVGGQRMSLDVAQRLGFVTKDAAGNWNATAQGNAQATMPEGVKAETKLKDGGTAEAAEAEGFAADEATEAALAEIIAAAGEGTSMAMVQSYLRDGDIDARLIDRAASQAGVEPAAMAEKLEAAMSGMEAAMDARLESLGVHDHDLLAEWIGQSPERLDQMREAVLSLMTSNSTAGWDALAESYVQSLDQIDPGAVEEACEDAGIPVKRVGGKMILTLPGGAEVSYGVAVRQGLIKVGRA